MDEASRLALEKAFELATKIPGQPWPETRIVEVAGTFRDFLTGPPAPTPPKAGKAAKTTTPQTPPDIDVQVPESKPDF